MASIGHLAVGAAVGALYSRITGSNPRTSILTFAGVALAPDLGLVPAILGVPEGSQFGHRGFSHSFTFALFMAGLVAGVSRAGSRRLALGAAVLAALASHGVLDTMSQQGDGPMLLWPFSTANLEFVWKFIPGVPTAWEYLTIQAIPTYLTEAVIFLPFTLFALFTFFSVRPPTTSRIPTPRRATSRDS